jgi:hypothetical protein
MLAVALMALAAMVPGVASAGESDNPLAKVPDQYEPALEAAANELGVSADKLKSASKKELQKLLCAELEGESAADVSARVKAAMEEVPAEELEGLSGPERQQLEAQLPVLVSQIKEACEESGVSDTEETDADESDDSDDDVPVPDRVDAGAGGVTGDTTSAPLIFGVVFAALFGLFGIAIFGMRRRA